MTEVGYNHTSRTECAAACTHWRCNNAQHSQYKSCITQPVVTHPFHEKARIQLHRSTGSHRIIEFLVWRCSCNIHHIHELHCCSSPDKSNRTFGHHRSVETAQTILFVLDATCHHRALRSMETAHCATGYGNEQAWEQGRIGNRVMIGKGLCNTWDVSFVCKYSNTDKNGHNEQRSTEDRIDGSDNFVNGEYRDSQIKNQNYNCPYQVGVGYVKHPLRQLVHQSCRNQHERGTHTNHQHQRNNTHHQTTYIAKLITDDFWKSHSITPDTYHTCHIIVHRSAQNASKNYP